MPVEDACMFGEFTRVGETPFPRVCAKSRFGTANPSGKRPFRTDSEELQAGRLCYTTRGFGSQAGISSHGHSGCGRCRYSYSQKSLGAQPGARTTMISAARSA